MDALQKVLESYFSPYYFRLSLPDVWAGFQLNVKMMITAELLVLCFALGDRDRPWTAGPRSSTAARRGDRLHGLLPRHAADPRRVPRRLRPSRAPARGDLEPLELRLRRDGAHARLHGVRDRGLPRRDRVGAPEPADGGALARPLVHAGDAPRRRAAGGAAGGAAAPQRLRRPAEGHGARDRDRRRRGGAAGAELLDHLRQLHLVRGRGHLLHPAHDPARRAVRGPDATSRPAAQRRERHRSAATA